MEITYPLAKVFVTSTNKAVLQNIHRDSDYSVSLWQYFAIQNLEEMLCLEFMAMIKRGIRVKRCALCDHYFVFADKISNHLQPNVLPVLPYGFMGQR